MFYLNPYSAYETLSDDTKRKTYDAFGMTGDEQAQAGAGAHGDPFSDFFRNRAGGQQGGGFGGFDETVFSDFESFFGGFGRNQAAKGDDILLNIEIGFLDAVRGAKKEVAYGRVGTCPTCNGSRCAPGSKPETCGTCAGKGKINYRQGIMSVQMGCSKCQGAGTIVKNPCKACKGVGVGEITQREDIKIPAGINHGQNLRVAGKVSFEDCCRLIGCVG